LLKGLRPEVGAILLDDATPAPAQIARALAREGAPDRGRPARSLEAVHVIAHGREGEVSFAAGALSLTNLAEHADDFERIGELLGEVSLNLWSCHTGKGETGAAFVEALAKASGIRIAASDGLVGAAGRGGCWQLRAGAPGAAAAAPLTVAGVEAYAGVMAGVYRIVSGDVPYDPAENVTYVVVNARDKRVVATFSLPGHANIPKFSIAVTVPSATETYEAGRLDARGRFIPANFTISVKSQLNIGGKSGREARHGA
jgi:hypothetical protein